ncbi:DUF927 domain-containing protein [Streptomyces diastaticus]|nr:DUF927 domain-containing protein [Streptomyces albidoflavus]
MTVQQESQGAGSSSAEAETETVPAFDAAAVLRGHGVQTDASGFGSALLAHVPGLPGPEHYLVPHGYRVNQEGVWAEQPGKDDVKLVKVTRAPLLISRKYLDSEGLQSVELAWRDGRRTVTGTVPRATMLRGKVLVASLGNLGFPAGESDSKITERWLGDLEAANRESIPETYLARYLGWQPDGGFVTSPTTSTVDAPHTDRSIVAEYRPHGTLEGWQRTVKLVEGMPRPRIAVAAGFAAPLLSPLGVKPFTLDFSGRSTGGKTTAAQGAISVWCNPSETSPSFMTWQSTLYGIEKRLTAVRGMPVLVDETMLANPEHLETLLYQLPSGRGKSRGGDYASGLEWDTILITTGERNALAHTSKQGAGARTVETTGAPFGTNGGQLAARYRTGLEENYGVAGPAFMEYVRNTLQEHGGPEKLRARHAQLTAEFLTGNPIADRRAPSLAALALGEEVAHAAGLLPYEPMPVPLWLSVLVTAAESDDRPTMALDVVREYLASHPTEFYGLHADTQPPRGWSGELKQDRSGRDYVAFMPVRLAEILDRAGYKLDAVADEWAAAGRLRMGGQQQRPPWKPNTKLSAFGKQVRCVCFWADALDGDALPSG